MKNLSIEELRDRLAEAESIRNTWRGKSEDRFKIASILVETLRTHLVAAEAANVTAPELGAPGQASRHRPADQLAYPSQKPPHHG